MFEYAVCGLEKVTLAPVMYPPEAVTASNYFKDSTTDEDSLGLTFIYDPESETETMEIAEIEFAPWF